MQQGGLSERLQKRLQKNTNKIRIIAKNMKKSVAN